VERIINEILEELQKMSFRIAKDKDRASDLSQDIILKLYDNEEKVKQVHEKGELLFWLYRITYNHYKDNFRNKAFYVQLTVDLPDNVHEEKPDTYEQLKLIYANLDEIERLWMDAYLECDLKYLEIERWTKSYGTGISRQYAAKEIKRIIKKLQHGNLQNNNNSRF